MSRPLPTSRTASSITSRLRRPRKSIFSRPSASTSPIGYCVTTSLSGALLLQRHESISGWAPITTPGGVDRVGPGQPLERPREIDDLLRHRVRVDRLAQLRAGPECVLEHLPRPLGHELRDPVDDAVRDLEHAPRIADRGPRRHRGEGDDLRDSVAPVLLGDVVDHAVAAADGEVDVGVGHRLAARVEEALEEQVVADRVDVGDVEAVGDEAACGGAAAGPDADAVALRERDEVPDDQEVVDEAHLADRLELVAKALGQLRRDLPVAALEPLLAQLDEVVEGVAAVRDRELRAAGSGRAGSRSSSAPRSRASGPAPPRARGSPAAISSGVLKKNSFVSKRQWSGFLSESPDWMQRSASCEAASSASR